MNYRKEIDGLRAIAVLSVIFYHAGFSLFKGGFVGVDVFFVISGYLITSIILTDISSNKFSIVDFYERRIRRIAPALFVVLAFTLVVSFFVLIPKDFKSFTQSLVAVPLFLSNFLFWRQSGYFDSASDLKPLLHTWSLAVEEQYYLFFPILMLFVNKHFKSFLTPILIVLGLMSLFVAQLFVISKPAATFFLLPTRGWELLIGALVAIHILKIQESALPDSVKESASLIGVSLLLISILFFDRFTPFPSVYALLPTVGTALIILFTTSNTLVGKVLGAKPLVAVGLLSYSAYLWHQPIFSFARHLCMNPPSKVIFSALILITFIVAYLSWLFIESPFRSKKFLTRKVVFILTFVFSVFFVCIGLIFSSFYYKEYKQFWLSGKTVMTQKAFKIIEESETEANYIELMKFNKTDLSCRYNTENISEVDFQKLDVCYQKFGPGYVILGDSHAIDLVGLVLANTSKKFIIGITQHGCRPHENSEACQYKNFLTFIEKHPHIFKRVIYEQAGFYLLRSHVEKGSRELIARVPLNEKIVGLYPDKSNIQNVIQYLSKLNKFVEVIWFGPRLEPHIEDKVILKLGCEYPYVLREGQANLYRDLDVLIKKFSLNNSNIKYLSQNELINFSYPRDLINCSTRYWSDGDHFSASGEVLFGKRFNIDTILLN